MSDIPEEHVSAVQQVQDLACVDTQTAYHALADARWNIIDAIDALLTKPSVAGDKYTPPKPKIDDGLTEEQRALCERGRWLQEKVNAVFSVAHSQIRSGQSEEVEEQGQIVASSVVKSPAKTGPSQDAPVQTPPPSSQSETPL